MYLYACVNENMCTFFLSQGLTNMAGKSSYQNSSFPNFYTCLPSSTPLRVSAPPASVGERGDCCVLLTSDFQIRTEG